MFQCRSKMQFYLYYNVLPTTSISITTEHTFFFNMLSTYVIRLLQFVFEGMEESGSEGLEELLVAEKDKFLHGVDFVCISDNYWLGKKKPCLTYGLRGICYYFCEVGQHF